MKTTPQSGPAGRKRRLRKGMETGASQWLLPRKQKGSGVELEVEAETFDDEVVVVALREAGDGDGSEDAGSGDVEGEAAAVGGVVGLGEIVAI